MRFDRFFKKDYSKIIRECYLEILNREPDETGFNHFLDLMKKNELDEKKLREILISSEEYKREESARSHDRKKPYIFKGLYNISYVIHPNSVLDNIIVKNGIYDRWITSRLKEVICPTDVIFDIGANAGLLSLPFAKNYVPKGRVYAFEPDSDIINQLRENIKINQISNITIVPVALQDNPSINKIVLYRRRAIHDDGLRNKGISSIQPNPTFNVGKETISVTTIDRYTKENGINNVSLMKIDVEGAEYRVLQGGNKTIDKFYPIIIYEYSTIIDKLINFQNSQKSFEFLRNKGYKQYQIVNEENLSELIDYQLDLEDSNVICFHESKLPSLSE